MGMMMIYLIDGRCTILTVEHIYQNPSRGGLSRYEFAGPVLGLGHKRALELLLAARGLLLLLLGVIWREVRLLPAADEREHAP